MNEMKGVLIQHELFKDADCQCQCEKAEGDQLVTDRCAGMSFWKKVQFSGMSIPDPERAHGNICKSRASAFGSKQGAGRTQVRQSPGASCSEGVGFGEHLAVPNWE